MDYTTDFKKKEMFYVNVDPIVGIAAIRWSMTLCLRDIYISSFTMVVHSKCITKQFFSLFNIIIVLYGYQACPMSKHNIGKSEYLSIKHDNILNGVC